MDLDMQRMSCRYSRAEIERVVRLAATLCMESEPPLPLFSLDKANVIATSRLWRNVSTELMAKEFPKVKVTHHLIDSAAMLMVKNPRALQWCYCHGEYVWRYHHRRSVCDPRFTRITSICFAHWNP